MSITVRDTGGDEFEPVPKGNHLATCFLLADIGLQKTKFGVKDQVIIGWELPNKEIEIGGEMKPMIIYQTYTKSLSKKANLRHDLETWLNIEFTEAELAGFVIDNILGLPCMVTVIHNTQGNKTYANVSSVNALPEGIEGKPASRKIYFDNQPAANLDDLPKWVKQKVESQLTASQAEAMTADNQEAPPSQGMPKDFDDDIPI